MAGDLSPFAEIEPPKISEGRVGPTLLGVKEVVPASPRVDELKGPRIIMEDLSGPRNFARREEAFEGKYTYERSLQAFRDYKAQRDLVDGLRRIMELQGRLVEARFHKNNREVRQLEQKLRQVGDEPLGGEVIYYSSNFDDAQRRVVELVGPSDREGRRYRYCRLGDEGKELREAGKNGPVNGFMEVSEFVDQHGNFQRFSKSWRIDYDKIKGPHFNVAIRPLQLDSNGNNAHFLENNHPESLNIAILFLGDLEMYKKCLYDIEISAITSLTLEEGGGLDYLPLK